MNQEIINILNNGGKCLIISTYEENTNLGICNYHYSANKIWIESVNYTNVIENLKNNSNCIIYITVCDETNIYYLIIRGSATLSSTEFRTPSLYTMSQKYLICISPTDIDLYKEKRR